MSKQTSFSDKMRNPRTKIYLPELFEELGSMKQPAQIKLIQEYNTKDPENAKRIRDYLQCIYHPDVVLDLPETIPPYDNTQYVDYDFAPLTLEKALARVKYFVVGHNDYIQKKVKREHVFIQTLESLHKKDSELLGSVLLKQFPFETYPSLGIEVFNKALPEYFPSVIDVDSIIEHEKTLRPVTKKPSTKAKK